MSQTAVDTDATVEQDRRAPERATRRRWRWLSFTRSEVVSGSATLLAFAVLLGPMYGLWLGKAFDNPEARVFDLYQSVPILLMSVGIVVPLACNQFDLSVAPLATLSTFMTIGLAWNQHLPLWLAIVIAVAVSLVAGTVNGFLVVRIRINAFIATLGTSGILAGLYTVYSGGRTVTPSLISGSGHEAFKAFTTFGGFQFKAPLLLVWAMVIVLSLSAVITILDRWSIRGRRARVVAIVGAAAYLGLLAAAAAARIPQYVSWNIVVLVIVAWLIWILLRLTTHGRALYAIGGSPTAAQLAGIPVNRYLYVVFMVSGVMAAVSGVMLAASQGTAVPGIADTFLLPAYAAAFLSTVILSSGRFHVWGTVLGGLLVVWVAQGLVVGGISYTWTDVINGVVLVCAVAFSTVLRRHRS